MPTLQILPVDGVGEIDDATSLGPLLADAAAAIGTPLVDGDCLVITQKIVSKAEGRVIALDPDDTAGRRRLIESESTRILRRREELYITETPHGFICANAGVDQSNVAQGEAALLPIDPDRSARRTRDALRTRGLDVAVVITDTFGRAWRNGLTDVAIGVAGLAAVFDLRGERDANGRSLQMTEIAIADEVAGAAELVMGKANRIPAAIVRGLDPRWFRDASVRELVRHPSDDLFR